MPDEPLAPPSRAKSASNSANAPPLREESRVAQDPSAGLLTSDPASTSNLLGSMNSAHGLDELEDAREEIRALSNRVTILEAQREKIVDFGFQSILFVMAVLTLAAGVPFAILYGHQLSGILEYVIAIALSAIVIIALFWLPLWWRLNKMYVETITRGRTSGVGAQKAGRDSGSAR